MSMALTVILFLFILDIPQSMFTQFLTYRQNVKQLELEKIKEENKRLEREQEKAERELLEFDRRLGVYSDENTVLYEDEAFQSRRR